MKKSKELTRLLLICALFLGIPIAKGQMVESQKTVDAIKRDIIDFLIRQNDLERGKDIKEFDTRTHISELLEENTLGYRRVGIYRIRIFTSHTKQYLLIKNGSEHQILDTDNFSSTLQSIVNFMVQQKIPNDKVAEYLESVIEIYRINENRDPTKSKED